MAFIVENGSGLVNANAYANEGFALDYLTTRNRNTENLWDTITSALRQAALVKGTDYIENRFALQFRGQKQFRLLNQAKGILTFTGQPADTETITIGAQVYTFNTILGAANSILIGTSPSASLANLVAAINGSGVEGTDYGTGTVTNLDVSALDFEGDVIVVTALNSGLPANLIATTDTVVNASWATPTLQGGSDGTFEQGLSFPRVNLFSRDGTHICGVPTKVKQASVEYGVRAVSAELVLDPTVDATGGVVIEKREKLDVIEEATKYQVGIRELAFRHYPAADNLLAEFLDLTNSLIR